MNDSEFQLWKIADTLRSQGRLADINSIIGLAESSGISINVENIQPVIALIEKNIGSGVFTCPVTVCKFVESYFEMNPPKRILDPWAGIVSLLISLVKKFIPDYALGLNTNKTEHQIAKYFSKECKIDWEVGEPMNLLDSLQNQQFDAIVGCFPFNTQTTEIHLNTKKEIFTVHDSIGNLVLLKALNLLSRDGSGLFVVSNSFFLGHGSNTVFNNLHRFGLFIDSEISIPSGSFAYTSIGGVLILVRREKTDRLFVAEIPNDLAGIKTVTSNIKNRREGNKPQLGMLIDYVGYRSYHSLLAHKEIEQLARDSGIEGTPLSSITKSVNLGTKKPNVTFDDLPNSVYLPTIGRSPAVASLSELKLKPQNYVQLALDPAKADAFYVARFFNTPLGQKVRESALSGEFIPKISKTTLKDALVFVPSTKIQAETIRLQSVITDISTQLDSLERSLWQNPQKTKDIEKALAILNHGDDFETWLETLPFPLASILWAFHANVDVKDKIEHLFHFFEALSEFVTTVMLSALSSDLAFCKTAGISWRDNDPRFGNSYSHPDFGTWNIYGARLAKAIRIVLTDKEKQRRCLEMFGNPEDEFMEMLSNKSLFGIFQTAADYRNRWKGHGGVVSPEDAQTRLVLLTHCLSQIRQIISDKYSSALFISPQGSEYRDGIYYYQVKVLAGTRTTFKKQMVETLKPMDSRKLYILHVNQFIPIELLPFVRLMESPKTQQNACYFYNRLSNGEIRWVSYYFEPESEVSSRNNPEFEKALTLLRPTA
jgi:hypothetical protein